MKVASPTIARVVPSKVILLVSSNSPEVPASTSLLSVKSDTLTVEATKPEPPDTSKPALASIAAANVATPATLKSSISVFPSISTSPLASILPAKVAPAETSIPPVTPNLSATNVKLPLSCKAPLVPATVSLPEVRSDTVAELKVVSPPEISAPALPSIAPPNVDTPVTSTPPVTPNLSATNVSLVLSCRAPLVPA